MATGFQDVRDAVHEVAVIVNYQDAAITPFRGSLSAITCYGESPLFGHTHVLHSFKQLAHVERSVHYPIDRTSSQSLIIPRIHRLVLSEGYWAIDDG